MSGYVLRWVIRRDRWDRHLEDSRTATARPAIGPDGEPGVAILTSGLARVTLTLDAAYTLAGQLARVIDDMAEREAQ
ncbi:hypothetical protein SCMU_27750 [Sinomonas cyclohexanicum]|uniref:Uncharacterized protein n=1 Tax=Sinomonas cyclohexanicum TaxID=322009 RepID=A0ABM7PXA9_SINCY|nr:hypothetical protein [Corynebacterium cyclohexanicum]BCT76933.1 hypothetical protein SCMU_27750 [Corynebacterium cyclohexanicum]